MRSSHPISSLLSSFELHPFVGPMRDLWEGLSSFPWGIQSYLFMFQGGIRPIDHIRPASGISGTNVCSITEEW